MARNVVPCATLPRLRSTGNNSAMSQLAAEVPPPDQCQSCCSAHCGIKKHGLIRMKVHVAACAKSMHSATGYRGG